MNNESFKTLYLCPNGYLGGAEKTMIDFCVGHQQRDWPAEILFFSDGPAFEVAKSYGIKCHLLPYPFRLSSPFKLLKACLYIRSLIKVNNFTVVHSTMPYAQIVAFLSTIFLPIKRFWYQHGPVNGTLDKIAIRTPSNHIFFNSSYLQSEHNRDYWFSAPLEKESIIPCAIKVPHTDPKTIEDIRSMYCPNGETLFLSTGRICSWKGYELAIEALNGLTQSKWKLLIIGSAFRPQDQEYEQLLKKMVNDKKLADQIIFLPFQKDIHNFLKAADILLHTSNVAEPFGLVVAEAMLQRTLVIGSSQGGIKDILIDRNTGISFDPIASDAVVTLLGKINALLLLSEEEKDKMTNNAYNLIFKRHNIQNCALLLEQHYKN